MPNWKSANNEIREVLTNGGFEEHDFDEDGIYKHLGKFEAEGIVTCYGYCLDQLGDTNWLGDNNSYAALSYGELNWIHDGDKSKHELGFLVIQCSDQGFVSSSLITEAQLEELEEDLKNEQDIGWGNDDDDDDDVA